MLRAETAVQGAAVLHLGAELQGEGAGLVKLDGVDVHLRVGADDALEPAVVRATFAHEDLVVTDDDLGIDDRLALGADASGQLVKYVVGVLLLSGLTGIGCLTARNCQPVPPHAS